MAAPQQRFPSQRHIVSDGFGLYGRVGMRRKPQRNLTICWFWHISWKHSPPPPKKKTKFNTVCISHCHNSTQVLYSTFVWNLLIFLMWCSGEHSEVLGSITSSGASNLGFTVQNMYIGCLLWVQCDSYLSGCDPASLQRNAGIDSSSPVTKCRGKNALNRHKWAQWAS